MLETEESSGEDWDEVLPSNMVQRFVHQRESKAYAYLLVMRVSLTFASTKSANSWSPTWSLGSEYMCADLFT